MARDSTVSSSAREYTAIGRRDNSANQAGARIAESISVPTLPLRPPSGMGRHRTFSLILVKRPLSGTWQTLSQVASPLTPGAAGENRRVR